MKYHSLFQKENSESCCKICLSAAVVIGALKVKNYSVLSFKGLREAILRSPR